MGGVLQTVLGVLSTVSGVSQTVGGVLQKGREGERERGRGERGSSNSNSTLKFSKTKQIERADQAQDMERERACERNLPVRETCVYVKLA